MKLAEHSHAPKSTNPVILMTIRPEPPLSHLNEQCKSSLTSAVTHSIIILINTERMCQC